MRSAVSVSHLDAQLDEEGGVGEQALAKAGQRHEETVEPVLLQEEVALEDVQRHLVAAAEAEVEEEEEDVEEKEEKERAKEREAEREVERAWSAKGDTRA